MLPHWRWTVLTLPPRHFSWRVRGNALYWSVQERAVLEDGHDLLVATSMVDLATLRGLVPALAGVPSLVYFHENQFEYPQHMQKHNLLEAQITSIYAALAADCVAFNSQYNRDTFMAGCAALLRRLPDRVPPGVGPRLQAKAIVLPVPIDDPARESVQPAWPGTVRQLPGRPLRLLWVGRFEHDKGADCLLGILRHLDAAQLDYEVAMTGQQFRRSPSAFGDIQAAFAHRLVHCGYIACRTQYRALLRGADLVLSTALHEFQGLAVMEAVAEGCLPVVPARLVYPELYPGYFCYASYGGDPQREAEAAAALIRDIARQLPGFDRPRPDMSRFRVQDLAPVYASTLASIAAAR